MFPDNVTSDNPLTHFQQPMAPNRALSGSSDEPVRKHDPTSRPSDIASTAERGRLARWQPDAAASANAPGRLEALDVVREYLEARVLALDDREPTETLDADIQDALGDAARLFGQVPLDVIASLIDRAVIPSPLASRVIRAVAYAKMGVRPSTIGLFLERYLQSDRFLIRDAAVLGMGLLGDPAALPALRQAHEREKISTLRRDIAATIDRICARDAFSS